MTDSSELRVVVVVFLLAHYENLLLNCLFFSYFRRDGAPTKPKKLFFRISARIFVADIGQFPAIG